MHHWEVKIGITGGLVTAYTMHINNCMVCTYRCGKLHTVHVDEGCGTRTSPLPVICHTTENVSLSYGSKCNDTDVIVEQGSRYMAYHAN